MSLGGSPIVGGECSTAGLGVGHLNSMTRHLEKLDRSLVHRSKPLVLNAATQQANGSGLTCAPDVPDRRPGTATKTARSSDDPPVLLGSKTGQTE
jgi:hypothetical protein